MRLAKHMFFAAGWLFCAAAAFSADTPADIDLRQAARLHRQGETKTAVAIWKKWAEQGNADAAYNLGLIHQHADGVPYSAAEALRWYQLAAERGDKSAQLQIGLMYQNGEGVPADEAKAHEWFIKNRREHVHHHHSPQVQQRAGMTKAIVAAAELNAVAR